jgi:hypothetical protein
MYIRLGGAAVVSAEQTFLAVGCSVRLNLRLGKQSTRQAKGREPNRPTGGNDKAASNTALHTLHTEEEMRTVQARVALGELNDENSAAAANQQKQCTPDSVTASVGKDAADKTQFAKIVREKLSQEFDKLAALLDQNISDTQLAPTEDAACDEADDTVDAMSAVTTDDDCSVATSSVVDISASSRVPRYTRASAATAATATATATTTSSPSADAQRRRSSSRIPVRRQSQSPQQASNATTANTQPREDDPDAVDEQIWARVRQRKQPQHESNDTAASAAPSRSTSVPMRAARLGLRNGGKSAAAATATNAASAAAPTAAATTTTTTTTATAKTKTMASRAASPSMRSVSRSRSRARDGLSTEERELQRAALARERLQQVSPEFLVDRTLSPDSVLTLLSC